MDKSVQILKSALVLAVVMTAGRAVGAEFTMNFMPSTDRNTNAPIYQCNRAGFSDVGCQAFGPYVTFETTPFLMEEVVVAGVNYVHIIVGDPADGFAQEVYIEGANGAGASTYTAASTYALAENHPTSGTPGLGPLTGPGNASANPEKVIMRQVVGGEWDLATTTWSCGAATFCADFFKDNLLTKPRITQTVIDGDMTSFFDMDMRGSVYSGVALADMVSSPIVNSVTLQNVPGAEFAMTPEYTNDSVVSGGRFIYTEGLGNRGSEGTYTYAEGDFDTAAEDWTIYRDPDPAVNPDINL